jgi:hypothetical protein
MAIHDKRIINSNGISYSKEVDGPSDWVELSNDTYFKDLSDGLIYWKDDSGTVIAIYERTTGSTISNDIAYFNTNNTLSAYTLNLSGYVSDILITTTYSGLTSLISTNSLTPGAWYQFEYQTKHLIGGTVGEYNDTSTHYDDGTGVKSTYVPETENLTVLALSSNTIHIEAKSAQYPNDIIYYDINDDTTEDGLESRPGFIIYREDTINSISAHYDWRNVLHRRYDVDSSDTSSSGRTNDFKTMVGYDDNSFSNHSSEPLDMLPKLVNFSVSGRSDIGPLNTYNENTYRDFKTFVGMDSDIYGTESGRYINIHIGNAKDQARIINSGFGSSGSIDNILTSNLYGEISNVVFFTRSCENVKIGTNASGIMLIGRTIKEVEIGNNNENIIIGGKNSGPTYDGTTANTINYVENIKIGNNNRNVIITGANRRITIGNNNTGVAYEGDGSDNTLGSYNTLVYSYLNNNNTLGDWMTTIRLSNSSNVTIGSESQTVDLITCTSQLASSALNFNTTATFPDGFQITTGQTNSTSTSEIIIGDRATNVILTTSSPVHLDSQVENILVYNSSMCQIGSNSKNISLLSTLFTTIGKDVEHVEASSTNGMYIDDNCTGIKIISPIQTPAPYKIGKRCSTIGIYGGVSGDIEIGNACDSVFISGNNVISIEFMYPLVLPSVYTLDDVAYEPIATFVVLLPITHESLSTINTSSQLLPITLFEQPLTLPSTKLLKP